MTQPTRIQPVAMLAADVKLFWSLEEERSSYNQDDIIPDSYTELIINVGAPCTLETDSGKVIALPRAYLNPLQTRPLRFRTQGFIQIISMRVYPWAVRPLLNVDTDSSDTHIIALDGAWQRYAEYLMRTAHQFGYEEAIQRLQEYVCERAYRTTHDVSPIRAAGHLLRKSQGQLRMSELAAHCYLSTSQFERRFKHYTAVSPKTYARLIRFEAVRNALMFNPGRRPVELAHEFGYSDQAHFIHDFKAFAACTPGEFALQAQANFDSAEIARWWAA
ncbi:MAG TPA: helix-turn-helix domain-containing protein [Aggregatilineales bacterium]|nr:helix-turn-helix domain-containing protein [Aggregatilineales bacterium]